MTATLLAGRVAQTMGPPVWMSNRDGTAAPC